MNETQRDVLRALGEAQQYQEQGETFLNQTGSTLEIAEAVPQKPPQWWNASQDRDMLHGIHYSCTLKNARGSYTFDFWGSIADAEKVELARDVIHRGTKDSPQFFALSDFLKEKTGKPLVGMAMFGGNKSAIIERTKEAIKPNAYDVLTCLQPMSANSFEDFCADYGYDTDSRTAEKTYNAMLEQDRNMRRLFDHAELDALSEIV